MIQKPKHILNEFTEHLSAAVIGAEFRWVGTVPQPDVYLKSVKLDNNVAQFLPPSDEVKSCLAANWKLQTEDCELKMFVLQISETILHKWKAKIKNEKQGERKLYNAPPGQPKNRLTKR